MHEMPPPCRGDIISSLNAGRKGPRAKTIPDPYKTWSESTIAFDTEGANHPYSIVANEHAAHLLTGPLDQMVHSRLELRSRRP
jgi:hypothetical protein